MGVLWTPGKRETQPDSATRVLTELPLARGLRIIKNLRSSEKLVTVGDPTSVVRKDGRGFYYSSGAYHTVESPVSFAGEITVVISVVVRSWPTTGVFFGRYAGATSNWERMPFSIQKSGSADQFTFGRSGESGSRSWYGIPGSLSVDTPYVVGWSSTATSVASRSTSSEKIWINGVKQTVQLDYAEGSGAFADYLRAIRIGAAEDNAAANSELYFAAVWDRALTDAELAAVTANPWQLFEPDNDPVFYSLAGGANTTGTLSSTLDTTTLTGVGAVTRSGTLAVTLDAATLAGIGTAAVTNKTGTLAVTLDTATLTSVGAVTRSGTLNSTLDAATLSGAGTVAVGTNRDGTLASTLADVTLTGIGAVTRSGTLSVTLDATTLAGIGSVGQPRTGTLSVTLDNVTLRGIGAIPAAPSTGGGKTTGKNLSRKQKKKLKAVESQEWLKAEETARQLLSDRFTKQTPQEKAQALETYIESLQPVIEALKAITSQIEEVVEEAPVIELTPHQEVIQRFDRLEKKVKSVEELIIILMADL